MKPGPDADLVYLTHMVECISRVFEYCEGGESSFRQSHLIQDAVIRNLQTMPRNLLTPEFIVDERVPRAFQAIWRKFKGM